MLPEPACQLGGIVRAYAAPLARRSLQPSPFRASSATFALNSGAYCLRFDIPDLLLVEDQQTANRSLCQCPNFVGSSTHDHEIISWRTGPNAGINGSNVRDMLLEAVESRFGTHRAPEQVEDLSDNGIAYTANETRILAQQLGLKFCFTPVKIPQTNGISEASVKTLKRDYVGVNPLPNAKTDKVVA